MTKVMIKGDIVDNATGVFYSWFDMDAVTPKSVSDTLLDAEGGDVEVDIASNGGDVFAASEIYTMLKDYPGKVIVNIQGLAASAATVIAMAGDEINMSPTAQMMIHQVWMNTSGNADDLRNQALSLDQADESIINAYELKTGLDRADLLQMMSVETWMNAQTALDKGFIDKIMFVDEEQPQLVNATHKMPSREAINRFMSILAKDRQSKPVAQLETEEQKQNQTKQEPSLRERKLALLRK